MSADWRRRVAPTLAEFDEMARAAIERLPEIFRRRCVDIVFQIDEIADPQVLDDLGIADPYELTGLYEGVDLSRQSIDDPSPTPNFVRLYRLPLLAEWIERGDITLDDLVRHVLVHEIGHHFGLSDEDIHRIEEEG